MHRWLRRFVWSDSGEACPNGGYHNAWVPIEPVKARWLKDGTVTTARKSSRSVATFEGDKRWPKKCACGYRFKKKDQWQVFTDVLYRVAASMPGGPEIGTEFSVRDAPAGALWHATWLEATEWHWKGPDGHVLMCKLPDGHDWCIDNRANNCTLPDDDEHRCWVREGEPPNVHVSKDGLSCAAGAGSIASGGYHGFLRHGHLESC